MLNHARFLQDGEKFKLLYATDCWDPETEARLIAWLNTLDPQQVHNAKGGVIPTVPLRQSHVGAVLASYYFERRYLESARNICDPDPMLFLGNAAPRPADNPKGVGARFVFAELEANVFYFGTFGPELSWVKPHIKSLSELNIEHENADTVFRSRFLPEAVSRWLKQDKSVFVRDLSSDLIPNPDKFTIFSIDSFGNIKLSLLASDELFKNLKIGQNIQIEIGGLIRHVQVSSNLGAAAKNQLLLAVGSSKRGLGDMDFGLDLYCQEGDASEQFKTGGQKPSPGDQFAIMY